MGRRFSGGGDHQFSDAEHGGDRIIVNSQFLFGVPGRSRRSFPCTVNAFQSSS